MRRLSSLPIGFVLVIALATAAAAQGRGGGNGNGRPKEPKTTTPAAPVPAPSPSSPASPASPDTSTAPAPSSTPDTASPTAPTLPPSTADATSAALSSASLSYRQFGAWLDDASAAVRGEGYTSVAFGHWRMDGVTQTNAPMVGVGLGVTDRLQVGANVPFYRVNWNGGSAAGLDDVYLSAKYTVLDPTLTVSEIGVAVSPVLEILSAGAPGGRVHYVLPVSVELRRLPFRLYGSAGYFSRGAFFGGGAMEWTAPNGLAITGALTQSYSLPEDALLDTLAVSRRRSDVSVSLGYPIGTRAVAFASVGRSLSAVADGGTSLAVTGGVAVRFNVNAAQP